VAGAQHKPRWGRRDYSAWPEPLVGRGRPTSKVDGREGKGGERIEEGKRRKGKGRNVAFHHLLLSNLTTGYSCTHMATVGVKGL